MLCIWTSFSSLFCCPYGTVTPSSASSQQYCGEAKLQSFTIGVVANKNGLEAVEILEPCLKQKGHCTYRQLTRRNAASVVKMRSPALSDESLEILRGLGDKAELMDARHRIYKRRILNSSYMPEGLYTEETAEIPGRLESKEFLQLLGFPRDKAAPEQITTKRFVCTADARWVFQAALS